MNITIHEINETNLQDAVRIYNSNEDFLRHHLAVSRIDEAFIRNEIKEMHDNGFVSTLIKLDGEAVAIMDYMPPRDGNDYLSLLMHINTKQGSGLGSMLYKRFEQEMIDLGATTIRIDVVNDYETNSKLFWEKMGFQAQGSETLTWGQKTSQVVVMKKML